ncbi:DUF222 domain-containing protein [Kribbella sp. NPDC050124]|uniref:DUF222 domain-containing protein n=1 Tax=Kribbella sp. NPDC050124 TaxID=3364114 RepID=UPI0037A304DD
MFDGDLTSLSTAGLLESAAEHRAEEYRAATRLIEHAQIYADRHHPDACLARPGRRSWEGRERSVVLGGDGCPAIAEFAVAEFGVMLGISPKVAADYLGQALALRHRFPFTWARVLAGEATPWRARLLTTACINLSEEAAHYVDQRLAPILDTTTPYRLDKIIKAAKIHADPAGARAEAEEKSRERGVFIGRTNDHGTKTIYIRTSPGDAIRFDATIAAIADAQQSFGDTRSTNYRRAHAVGIIADPRFAEELLLQAREQHLHDPTPGHAQPDTGPAADAASGAGVSHRRTTKPARTASHGTWGDKPATAPASTSWADDELPSDWSRPWREPGPEDEADRDAPHPSDSEYPDPLDVPFTAPVDPAWPGPHATLDPGETLTPDAQRALNARFAKIKHQAHCNQTTQDGADRPGRLRPGKTEIYVHLTDHTLATGTGVLRAEGIGPLFAAQLTELIGHGPYVVKPVIDLNDAVSVDAYEIPHRIRECIKLTHPVELFPYGTRETNRSMDVDHIQP